MAKDFVKITKDGITRTIRANEVFDYQRRGWIAEGQKKPIDVVAMNKELTAAKAELAKSAETIKTLTAEKAALTAELDKAKAELAKGSK